MRSLIPRFPYLLGPIAVLLALTSVRGQDDNIDCPDASLTEYLVALIDKAFDNGLSTFENLIVHLAESDQGYTFLHDELYLKSGHGDSVTILVPTDQAWGDVGIWPPFDGLGDDWITEVMQMHVLQGSWTRDNLPSQGHGVASTSLRLSDEYNATESASLAYQAMVLSPGEGTKVVVEGCWGNATSWDSPVNVKSAGGVLSNVVILPIDQVLPFPPSVGAALSSTGMSNMSAALSAAGVANEVEQLTQGGFTMFVPVDEAWTGDARALLGDGTAAKELVGNHYTTSYSLYSPLWIQPRTFDLEVQSGANLTVRMTDDGSSTVTLGDVEAKIIRSDITLRNGVMHIIDKVLTSANESSMSVASEGTSSSIKPGKGTTVIATATAKVATVTATATSDGTNGVAGQAGAESSGSPGQPVASQSSAGRLRASCALVVLAALFSARWING